MSGCGDSFSDGLPLPCLGRRGILSGPLINQSLGNVLPVEAGTGIPKSSNGDALTAQALIRALWARVRPYDDASSGFIVPRGF